MSCSLQVQNHFVMMLKKYVGRRFWISKCRARVDKRNKDKVKDVDKGIAKDKNEVWDEGDDNHQVEVKYYDLKTQANCKAKWPRHGNKQYKHMKVSLV